jgi:hypothetical protein
MQEAKILALIATLGAETLGAGAETAGGSERSE